MVPKSERNHSKAQFEMNAYKLFIITADILSKLPKRVTFYISQPTAKCAEALFEEIEAANSFRPSGPGDIAIIDERRKHFIEAKGKLSTLVALMEAILEQYEEHVNMSKFEEFAFLAESEERLLNGILESDKKRYHT